ncbi:MAG: acetate kinase, partial [Firmicutes bacterium]|nr:acetate kinase [Bacillota bacterium]
LVHSIRKYIGAYAAVLGGVDAIVFTAGIGENNIVIRQAVMEGFEYLGAKLDIQKNNTRSEAIISTDDSKVKVCVIPTNEELVIARDTLAIVTGKEISD